MLTEDLLCPVSQRNCTVHSGDHISIIIMANGCRDTQRCGHTGWSDGRPEEKLREVAPEARKLPGPLLTFLSYAFFSSWSPRQRPPNLALPSIHQEGSQNTASWPHSQTESMWPDGQGGGRRGMLLTPQGVLWPSQVWESLPA